MRGLFGGDYHLHAQSRSPFVYVARIDSWSDRHLLPGALSPFTEDVTFESDDRLRRIGQVRLSAMAHAAHNFENRYNLSREVGRLHTLSVWARVLLLALLLVNIGCRVKPPAESNPTIDRRIQVPGEYVVPDIDRGKSQPSPTSVSPAQDVLAGLPMGRVVFACPAEMRVRATERVEVRISSDPNSNLMAGLRERGIALEQSAKIAPVMKVTLIPEGRSAFDIQSLSEGEQLISSEGFSQWVWSVTPLQAGIHNLDLTVNVVVNVPQLGAQKRQIPVLTQTVKVRADPVFAARQFWSSNWQWLTTTLLIPLGLWLWKRRSKSAT